MTVAMRRADGFRELAEQYDAFLLDVWGVIHDGRDAYPAVSDTMQALKSAGTKVLFLSNAPRRASKVREGLARHGIAESDYLGAISSGETLYQQLVKNPDVFGGRRYTYIGPEKDSDLLEGLPLECVTDASEAQFAVCTGFDHDDQVIADKQVDLDAAYAAKLPLICANPDDIIVRRDGSRALCAGVLAEAYQAMGGVSHYYGKPHADIYALAMQQLGDIPKPRIAAIGDNLRTDIRGGRLAGIDTVLVTGGILSVELGHDFSQWPDSAKLGTAIADSGERPDWITPCFQWA